MSSPAYAARERGSVELDAILVGRVDLGEADRVLRWLTPTRGLVATFARGARRARSAFAVLDTAVRATIVARPGRGELYTLLRAEVTEPRVHLREDYDRLVAALHACEVIAALVPAEHREPRQFGLLETAILLLDHASAPPGAAFSAAFDAKALTFAGVCPRLDGCVACGSPPEPRMSWAPAAGGLYHPGCVPPDAGPTVPVEARFVVALELARRTPLQELYDAGLPPGPADLLSHSLSALVGRGFRGRAGGPPTV